MMGRIYEAQKDINEAVSLSSPPTTLASASSTDVLTLPADGSCDSLPA